MSGHFTSPLAAPAVEQIWIDAAAAVGLRVRRTRDAYASSDGQGTIAIGEEDLLDHNDAVAQLVFHELCHALVEGDRGWSLPDWGLDNSDGRDVAHEHACLRLQVHLAAPHGLRQLMAPTTEYRAYHDRLPDDALAGSNDSDGDGADPSLALARAAAQRAAAAPWCAELDRALALTAAWLRAGDAAAPAASAAAARGETCGSCAWRYAGGRGKAVTRCRQWAGGDGQGRRTTDQTPACERWEPPVDCEICGACCREAYHSVTVSVRDPVVWLQPSLIMRHGHRFEIQRAGDRCAALLVSAPSSSSSPSPSSSRFRCSIYTDRPQACRDFEAGGRHCLDARRRVGLSP
jgi:hypothetical protein